MKTEQLGCVCFLEMSLLIKSPAGHCLHTGSTLNREPVLLCALGECLLAMDLKFLPIFHYGKIYKADACDRVDVEFYLELENIRISCSNYSPVGV